MHINKHKTTYAYEYDKDNQITITYGDEFNMCAIQLNTIKMVTIQRTKAIEFKATKSVIQHSYKAKNEQ